MYPRLAVALSELGERARGLRATNPARAAALEYTAGVVAEALRDRDDKSAIVARMRRSLAEVRPLRERYPDSLDVAKVALAAAQFAEDRTAAFAEISAPPSKEAEADTDFMIDRVKAAVGLVGRAPDAASIAKARAVLAEARSAPSALGRNAALAALDADLSMFDAIVGDAHAWGPSGSNCRRPSTNQSSASSPANSAASRQSHTFARTLALV